MAEPFSSAPHHDVLALVVQIAVLLLAARGLGEVAQRIGQPPVVGELLAGILLGPSLLAGLFPTAGIWIVPQSPVQGYLLEVVGLLGVMFLLVITGLETDLALIVRHARTALSVSWGGVLVTFSTGFALGWVIPDFLLVDPQRRLVFALFLATALSISAIPVIAKVLIDLNLMRRDVGQTILAAGMSDDTIGWILLGIVAGLAQSGTVSPGRILQTVSGVVIFLVVSFTLGRRLVKQTLDFVQDEVISRDRLLTVVVFLTFAWGALTQALGLEPVLGAFVMGILFGQHRRLPEEVHHKLESLTLGIFAPIFFAMAGLKVNLRELADPLLIVLALGVILVATLGKVGGTYLGARLFGGKDHWTSLSFGAGLNARGALEIIIATIGLRLGVLGQEMFSIIVLMAMATSLMAPFALRFVLNRVTPGEEELERLRREELEGRSLVPGIHRVLLPVRVRSHLSSGVQTVESRVLERLASRQRLAVTLLTVVDEPAERSEALAHLDQMAGLYSRSEIARKIVVGHQPAQAILDELRKDYDLMVMGATEAGTTSAVLFTPMVDFLVRMAPCPTIVVKGADLPPDWAPRRILVPTGGTVAGRRAAELAFALRPTGGEQVTILNVVVDEALERPYDVGGALLERRLGIAHQLVEELRSLGESLAVRTEADVRAGQDIGGVILEVARSTQRDLIILGTSVRPGSDRLYLGPRVERILREASCPVLVLNV